jgi:hypothetical protein
MLAQDLQRKDAKEQRRKGHFVKVGSAVISRSSGSKNNCPLSLLPFASLHLCVFALILLSLSCGSKRTDMRALAPADSLVYLESNDLAAALQPIIDSKPFTEAAKYKPDLSPLKGVQIAVAVTGFETSEEKVDDERSIGRVQAHFVAIADTHAWNFQAVAFAEKKLGSFVAKIYDSEPTIEKSEKNGGEYFTWTSDDHRKAYALVLDSLIYFGNDEISIDKCLAIRRGEADSISKIGKLPPVDPTTLASGYVSTDGIAQIANVLAIKLASEISDESEVQSAIAGIVPQLLRNSITSLTWSAANTELGIEDKYIIGLQPDIAPVLTQSMSPHGQIFLEHTSILEAVPADASTVTLYSFENPLKAWQTLVATAQKKVDPLSSNIIGEFAKLLLEPYGIRDPDGFLDQLDDYIVTARFDDSDDKVVLLASEEMAVSRIKKPLTTFIEPNNKTNDEMGREVYVSEDGDLKAVFDPYVILGESDSVSRCLTANSSHNNFFGAMKGRWARFDRDYPSILTFNTDKDAARQIADIFSSRTDGNKISCKSVTQTKFTLSGIERQTVSDFGLIGSIIAHLAED